MITEAFVLNKLIFPFSPV